MFRVGVWGYGPTASPFLPCQPGVVEPGVFVREFQGQSSSEDRTQAHPPQRLLVQFQISSGHVLFLLMKAVFPFPFSALRTESF